MLKHYIWNPATYTCENGEYIASIIYDSVVTCDQVIEETKTVPTKSSPKIVPKNFNKKKETCKTKNFYILLSFLLITTALLIFVGICYCFIKYQTKQKTFISITRLK